MGFSFFLGRGAGLRKKCEGCSNCGFKNRPPGTGSCGVRHSTLASVLEAVSTIYFGHFEKTKGQTEGFFENNVFPISDNFKMSQGMT